VPAEPRAGDSAGLVRPKDFTDPATAISIPEPPPGTPKGWFDDVVDFVSDAAPVVLPIVMSLI